MPLKTEGLDGVYGATSVDEIHAAYQDWAETYDAETLAKGFWLPAICAGYMARHVDRDDGPILDAGCGTGLVGAALSALGFARIDGIDLSPAMLERARMRGVYTGLSVQELGRPIPVADASYAAFGCFGSFGPGHAPPDSLDELVRITRAGGMGLFNVIEASSADQGFDARIAGLAEAGRWRVIERSEPIRAFLLAEPELLTRIYVCEVL